MVKRVVLLSKSFSQLAKNLCKQKLKNYQTEIGVT